MLPIMTLIVLKEYRFPQGQANILGNTVDGSGVLDGDIGDHGERSGGAEGSDGRGGQHTELKR